MRHIFSKLNSIGENIILQKYLDFNNIDELLVRLGLGSRLVLLLRGPRWGVVELTPEPVLDNLLERPRVKLSAPCRTGVPVESYVLYEYRDEGDPDLLPAARLSGSKQIQRNKDIQNIENISRKKLETN